MEQTDGRQTYALSLPLDAASVISNTYALCSSNHDSNRTKQIAYCTVTECVCKAGAGPATVAVRQIGLTVAHPSSITTSNRHAKTVRCILICLPKKRCSTVLSRQYCSSQ